MKSNLLLSKLAGKPISQAAMIIFLTSMSLVTACNKQTASAPTTDSERLTGYVQEDVTTDDQGTNNGFFWSLYREGGSASITHGAAGNFAISYSNVNDVVGGKGWNPGSARTIGYNVGALSGSYNFVGVYGWTTSP
nr:glycoside hydrolase family 11 protein [Paraflavitalea speifideiaquila]